MCLEKHFECVCLSLTLVSSLVSACVPISMHLVGYHHQLSELEKHFECVCLSQTLFQASVVCVSNLLYRSLTHTT